MSRPLRLVQPSLRVVGSTMLAGGLACTAAFLPQSPASAAAAAYLTVSPAAGTTDSSVTLSTSGPCANEAATAIQARISGAGFPAAGQSLSGVTPFDSLSNANGGYDLPLFDTLRGYGNVASPPVVFSGTYTLTIRCRTNTSGTSLGEFTQTLKFSSPTKYTQTALVVQSPSPAPTPAGSPTAAPGSSPTAAPTPAGSPTAAPTPAGSPTAAPTTSPTAPTPAVSPSDVPASPGPTDAPTASGTVVALDGEGGPLVHNPNLTRGQQLTLKAPGFAPGEVVTATVFSTPAVLGTTVADSAGLLSFPFTVPADLEDGNHRVELAGMELMSAFTFTIGENAMSVGIAYAAPPAVAALPRTGTDTQPLFGLGLGLLVTGGILMVRGGRLAAPTSRGRHALS